MHRTNTSERLKQIMRERNLRQVDILNQTLPLCRKYGVKMNKSDISQYVSGKAEPSQDKLVMLGMSLGVTEAWLMGFDVPANRDDYIKETHSGQKQSANANEYDGGKKQTNPHTDFDWNQFMEDNECSEMESVVIQAYLKIDRKIRQNIIDHFRVELLSSFAKRPDLELPDDDSSFDVSTFPVASDAP